jgi:2-amino-4-hydroxy-6-hydroxymethyldihydropteridine diphosphokinase
MMYDVAISLGSNLGDREIWIEFGVQAVARELEELQVSSVYETAPELLEDQPLFLNACCTGRTRLTPRQLLSQLQDAERAAGRDRSGPRYGPRTRDLDLLLYGDEVIGAPDLTGATGRDRRRMDRSGQPGTARGTCRLAGGQGGYRGNTEDRSAR